MSKTKWTPGPWVFFGHHLGCGAQSRRADVAHCDGFDSLRPTEEEHANAHIIAAAPDLYEALQAAVDRDGFDELGNDASWLNEAIAALAKARGES